MDRQNGRSGRSDGESDTGDGRWVADGRSGDGGDGGGDGREVAYSARPGAGRAGAFLGRAGALIGGTAASRQGSAALRLPVPVPVPVLAGGAALIGVVALLAALAGPGHAAGERKSAPAQPGRVAAGTVDTSGDAATPSPAGTPGAGPTAAGGDGAAPPGRAALVVDPSEVTADSLISRNQAAPRDPNKGPVTNLPLPRYVSLKGSEGNARRGPSLSHRIDWVFRHPGMPLRVVAEFGHWRRIEDQDGAGGWVHYSLLSGVRTVLVTRDMVELRARPEAGATTIARAEAGAILRLSECNRDWCAVGGDGARGWVEKTSLWGVDADEIRQ